MKGVEKVNKGEKQLKTVAKSLRMTPEVYDYVLSSPGDGFNQKFESLVLEAKRTEPERREIISALDRKIQRKSMQLDKISNWVVEIDDSVRQIIQIEGAIQRVQQRIEKILEE